MNVERLQTTRSALGRHLARVGSHVQEADRLHGRRRKAVLRNAARHFMQAGFHHLAKDIRHNIRKGLK